MKLRNFLSCLLTGLISFGMVSVARGDEPVLPEKLFPQLDSLLRAAVGQSPRMVSRQLDLEMSEQDRLQARAGLLPSVGGYLNLEKARDVRGDVDQTMNEQIRQYDFRLTQPIFHWGEVRNNARMGEIRHKIALGQYKDGYRLLAIELRAKYLNLILAKHIVARYTFNKQFAQQQLTLAEDKLSKKIIADSDIFPLRVNVDRANIDLERESFNYDNARQTFARLSGVEEIRDEDIPELIPKLAYQPDAYVQLLSNFQHMKDPPTFEAERIRRNIEIQELTYQNQKTRLRPKLNFIAGTTRWVRAYNLYSFLSWLPLGMCR